MTASMLIALLWLAAGAALMTVAAALLAGAWGLLAAGAVCAALGALVPWEKIGGSRS